MALIALVKRCRMEPLWNYMEGFPPKQQGLVRVGVGRAPTRGDFGAWRGMESGTWSPSPPLWLALPGGAPPVGAPCPQASSPPVLPEVQRASNVASPMDLWTRPNLPHSPSELHANAQLHAYIVHDRT